MKEVNLIKEKRSIHKCVIQGQNCYYVQFTNLYKETQTNWLKQKAEREYDETLKSHLLFDTKEKAEQYSRLVTKCDVEEFIELGSSPSDTKSVSAILIYPTYAECLKDYGCFGCINEEVNGRYSSNTKGFTFFPYLTNDKLYCDLRNTGCMPWEQFSVLDNTVSYYVSKLRLNVDFPEEEIASYEVLHISKNRLAALQSANKELAEARQMMYELEQSTERSEKLLNALAKFDELTKEVEEKAISQ